ncbi:hypothetical protein CEXT_334101 [Caerostris extrusa]|uniref:Uncharacterized protein n=1 Tax=Caerostris extrusa TaxID=172846 RepID=A0AAV4XZI0_CAEEX|nr:hypothetical protein CEXT_334101 [Caerostris extrusa]
MDKEHIHCILKSYLKNEINAFQRLLLRAYQEANFPIPIPSRKPIPWHVFLCQESVHPVIRGNPGNGKEKAGLFSPSPRRRRKVV